MTLHDSASSSRRKVWFGRTALCLAAAWFLFSAAFYVVHCEWRPELFRPFNDLLKYFFGWQAGGFFALAIIVGTRRPAIAGGVLGAYLAVSTLVLLAFSHNAALIANFTLFLLWMFFATVGMRRAIARIVGTRYATWGVAAAAVYAALIPTCFLLGLIHGITRSNVAALSIATALPGAILGWWRAPAAAGDFLRRIGRLTVFEMCLIEVIWTIPAISLVNVCLIETGSDSVHVHLPYIHQVVADHGVSHPYACFHRLQPMAVQVCCATMAAVGSDLTAKWFSWLSLVILALLVGEEVFLRSRWLPIGLFAAAAVLGCPHLMELAQSLLIDHVMTMLCVAGFVVLLRALRPPCLAGILFSAAIMAQVVQVKYTGCVFAAVWGGMLFVGLLRQCRWRTAVGWTLAGGCLFLALAWPWYAYVYAGTGNPFFPYLHAWFHSPYWADGFTMQQVFERTFNRDPGIAGILTFPWTATFYSSRFMEDPDGALGFWAFGLAACWFLARPRRAAPYWDIAIAGVAMTAGIAAYTPYLRYWLPAYPLLVAAGALAAGSLLQSVEWRPKGRWPPVLLGIASAAVLFLPAPKFYDVKWKEYTRRISVEDQYANRFPEYPMTQRLNPILDPHDGVFCTGCEGVYLVAARPTISRSGGTTSTTSTTWNRLPASVETAIFATGWSIATRRRRMPCAAARTLSPSTGIMSGW